MHACNVYFQCRDSSDQPEWIAGFLYERWQDTPARRKRNSETGIYSKCCFKHATWSSNIWKAGNIPRRSLPKERSSKAIAGGRGTSEESFHSLLKWCNSPRLSQDEHTAQTITVGTAFKRTEDNWKIIEFNRGCMVEIFNLPFQLFIFSNLKRKELIIIIQKLMITPPAAWVLLWSFWKDERDHEGCSTDWLLFSWAMLVAVASLAHRLGTRPAGITLPNACWVGLAVFVSF